MSELQAAPVQGPLAGDTIPPPKVALPSPLPVRYPTEPQDLTQFRRQPRDDKMFVQLRRAYRDAEDWRALATVLVLHAAAIEKEAKHVTRAAELCVQSYELWLERVKDREAAASALARAVQLKPDNQRALERLRKLYEALGSYKELVTLLRWRLATTPSTADAVPLHLELAELLEEQFLAIGEAVEHYEQALMLDPGNARASERLTQLYLQAGAWQRGSELMAKVIERLDPTHDRHRVAELYRRLAAVESEQMHNVAAAARYLQAALKVVPDDIDALQAFGVLYLSSGKATDDGVSKAADIFYKAAEIARRRGDKPRALKLLRRCLNLMPDHQQASAALENTLIDAEDYLALDDLYREWLYHFSGPEAVPLLLRRAELLDGKLERREEARQLYEEASRYQKPDGEAWRRLEQIYTESKDYHALASLLDAQLERMPDDVPTETLLRAAAVYRDELGLEERAAVYFYKVLEREPFNGVAFEGYKEHWRRKHNWTHLRDLILYQIEQATSYPEEQTPLRDPTFAEEFVELADICERRLGDIDGALDAWGRLAAAYPSDARPGKHIARIEKRARMWDNMVRVQEAELERAVDPIKRLDILKRLTQVYRDRQVNPERAIELYNEILSLSPNDVQATRALTALYDRAGDFGQVVEMLRDQYDRSRSNTERVSLLRRMAELWHHELEAPEEAIWACEQILAHAPADKEAMYRLQQILEEQEQYQGLYDVLERELKHAGSQEAKIKIMRRMARLAERELGDEDRGVQLYNELQGMKPSLEITDKLVDLYERAGRYEDQGALLQKAASAPATPLVRQLDFLLRLGHLAEAHLDDPALARSSFETVLRQRPDHRGALEALVRIYRREEVLQPLVAILGKLQELAETEEDSFRIAWERAELLADQLEDPDGAAQILEATTEGPAVGNREVGATLLELYERSGQHRKVIRQAEIVLLATDAPEDRRRLYETIATTWREHLKDIHAALSAYTRYIDEFSRDLEGLRRLAELQLEVQDYELALSTLDRRLQLADHIPTRVSTLEKMAEIAEHRLGDGGRALEYLRRGLQIDHFNEPLIDKIREVAQQHGLWEELLGIQAERVGYAAEAENAELQVEVCTEAAVVAEAKANDHVKAFEWARRGYFVGIGSDLPTQLLRERLERLAEQHKMWDELLDVIEKELSHYESRGPLDSSTHPSGDEGGTYDAVGRLLAASEIAEHKLGRPERAVGLLQRAHRLRPRDEELAARLQSTAERYKLWQAVIEMQGGRLERAVTDLGRFDACMAIARIYEEELDDPEKAFEWVQKSEIDLEASDPRLAKQAFGMMQATAERHGLWRQMCEFHLARANDPSRSRAPAERLQALRDAASVFHERLGDPLAAVRVLTSALHLDPKGEVLIEDIRALTLEVDEKRDGDLPAVGALMLLGVLQRLCEQAEGNRERQTWIVERARVREERLEDINGAMAEWLRVLQLDPDNDEALVELERVAGENDVWNLFLVQPAWQLEQANNADARARLLKRIARLYEGPLERPEYALRARLASWRIDGELPPRVGELDADHRAIWRLAAETGDYNTPPVPKDALLRPSVAIPEIKDLEILRRCGIDPKILAEIPSPHAPKLELAVPLVQPSLRDEGAVPSAMSEDISLTELADDEESDEDRDEEMVDLDDIEEIEFEDLEEIGSGSQTSEQDATVAGELGAPAGASFDGVRTTGVDPVVRPPPPPRAVDAGLPALPKLTRPVLPTRPKVASAWEEVALTYADVPTADKQEQADVALVLARVWEEGAGSIERAFRAHERALIWVPEYEVALDGLRGLAERHAEGDRLRQAYELLLSEAALPDQIVAMGMRLAQLHEARDDVESAEASYRGVLAVTPQNTEALRSLCRIFESQERWNEYIEVFGDLLDAEHEEIDDDERVRRSMEIARLQSEALGRKKEAIERLEMLVRTYPQYRGVHDALIELLVETRQWQPAVEAMRVASDAVADEDYLLVNLARAASLYEERLGLPDRAIHSWQQVIERRDDPVALGKLQQLYLDTSNFEPALPIIERRLALLEHEGEGDKEARISLLVAKARVLQEGLGNEDEAMRTLEQLLDEAPDNDEVALGLSRLYRKQGRLEDGIDLIRTRWQQVDRKDAPRFVAMTTQLASVLDSEGHDPKGALEVVNTALEDHPKDATLLRQRAKYARALHDLPQLAAALSALSDPDALLEAANLFRGPLDDGAKAVRLYSRVLAEAKKDPDDTHNARLLASALEGLVRLRIDDGDIQGAMEFMDKQLAEMTGSSIRAQLLTEMGSITFRSTGNVAAAQQRFDAALKEDPDYARAKLGKAAVLIESGDTGRAEQLLTEAVEGLGLTRREEELVEALVLLGRVLEMSGRAGEAYRRLTAASRHAPDNLGIRAAIVRNRLAASRWRDATVAADHVEQQLAEGIERTPQNVRLVSDIFVMAAEAEKELKQIEAAVARYRRAAEIDPSNPAALEPLITLCQERGSLVEAARHASTLARMTEEASLRGQRYVEAGMLYHDAAQAMADGAEPVAGETEADLRKAAFESLRLGLELVEGSRTAGTEGFMLDRDQLEVAFRASAEHDHETALRCLEGLLAHPSLPLERKHDLLLEGVRLSLNADDGFAAAERYAATARQLSPRSSAAVLAQARVLEATDRVDEIEPLVERFIQGLDQSPRPPGAEGGDDPPDDVGMRIELLLRLAELQESRPEKAVAALERAVKLDPGALDADARKHLADLYDKADITGTRVLQNHLALLRHEPLYVPSLAALAKHYAELADLDRAYALYRVLLMVEPEHDSAKAFLAAHRIFGDNAGEFHFDELVDDPPSDGGVHAALMQLWDGGGPILAEHLPRIEVPPDSRVSPLGDDLLATSWGEMLKRLGQSKVALVDDRGLTLDAAEAPDGAKGNGYFHVRWQQPAIIIAHDRARDTEDPGELRFALGRALYFTRPEAVFATGLRRATLAQLLSATMQAFHPRHGRRKHHQKADSPIVKLSQELARKLPMRVSRQLSQLFKDHEGEAFDSRAWRGWIRRTGNRVGLTLGGDIEAAIRVLVPQTDLSTVERLVAAVKADDELRDLIAFATSESFVAARRQLGFSVAKTA
jgi:tetratricopeptide (TPR) repeat protein